MVRIFGPDFIWSGTWSGFRSGLEPGPVRGTDFGPKKSVPGRIFFRSGPWSGDNFRKIENFSRSGYFQQKLHFLEIRTGPKIVKYRSGPDFGPDFKKMETLLKTSGTGKIFKKWLGPDFGPDL